MSHSISLLIKVKKKKSLQIKELFQNNKNTDLQMSCLPLKFETWQIHPAQLLYKRSLKRVTVGTRELPKYFGCF